MAKVTKKSLEEQVKTMQNHFGAIISTVKDLKTSVETLQKRFEQNQTSEVEEIVETQRVLDEIVVANSDAIKQIKSEMANLKHKEHGEAFREEST